MGKATGPQYFYLEASWQCVWNGIEVATLFYGYQWPLCIGKYTVNNSSRTSWRGMKRMFCDWPRVR